MSETKTSVLRTTIVKPVDASWEDVGRQLRDIRSVAHRVMNRAITELALNERQPALGDDGKRKHPQTLAYRFVRDAVTAEVASAQAAIEPAKMAKKSAEHVAKLERLAALTLASGLLLGWAGDVFTKYKKFRADWFSGASSLTSFRDGYPIVIAGGQDGWSIAKTDRGFELSVRLSGGRGAKDIVLIVQPDGPSAYAQIAKMVSGESKIGDLKLIYLEKKKKWVANMTHTWAAPTPVTGRTMVVHRGIRNALVAATGVERPSDEPVFNVIRNGEDLLAFKRKLTARRKSIHRLAHEVGRGGRGHGTSRRYEVREKLEAYESNWVKSWNQTTAAQLVRECQRRGVGTVVLESFGTVEPKESDPDWLALLVRQWPFAALKGAIVWACEKNGISVREVSADYISQECPKCGFRADDMVNAHGTFLCRGCGLERSVDQVASWNMLKRHGIDPGIAKDVKKRKAVAKAIRGERKKGAA